MSTDLGTDATDLSSEQLAFSQRAQHLIPGGAHTYSKGDDQLSGNAPRGFVRGKGARVWDIDGREFVDWGMGINCVLLGHAQDEIDDAAIAAIRGGQNFSRPTPLEVQAAEEVVGLFPGLDMIKFAKNGSDANTAAVRLARAITGRAMVGFDGTTSFLSIHDWFIGNTVVNAGVPEAVSRLAVSFRYNDLESVEQLFADHRGQLAALILEPGREIKPAPGFLEGVRRLCDENGTLLIFDEVVSAFRYDLHGAHSLAGVLPDLMSLGKGMANGYALTALVGKREYMERGGLTHSQERVFLLSTTNGAEQSGLAAGLATVRFYRRNDVIGQLARVGQRVIDGLNQAAQRHGIEHFLKAVGDFSSRPYLLYLDHNEQPSAEFRTLFVQEMVVRNIFMPWICPSFSHGDVEIERTIEAFDGACAVYARAIEQRSVEGLLRGPAAKPVFRKFN